MPKSKPHKGMLKRVTVSARGKVKWKRTGSSHLNSHMTGKQGLDRRKKRLATPTDIPRLEQMLKKRLRPGATPPASSAPDSAASLVESAPEVPPEVTPAVTGEGSPAGTGEDSGAGDSSDKS